MATSVSCGYNFKKIIGMGSFSTVFQAEEKITHKTFAIKVYNKLNVLKNSDRINILKEQQCLTLLEKSKFIVKMIETFENKEYFYIVMNFGVNGNLASLLEIRERFDRECCRFYSAQILLGLEYMHKFGIIHRDLKPENIILDEKMNAQIIDFGSSIIIDKDPGIIYAGEKSVFDSRYDNRLVGSVHYVSPEMLNNRIANRSSDLWSFGVLVFYMISGSHPFMASNEYLIFKKIINTSYDFTEYFDEISRNFIYKILKLNPIERMGAKDDLHKYGYISIKCDKFFMPFINKWAMIDAIKSPILT